MAGRGGARSAALAASLEEAAFLQCEEHQLPLRGDVDSTRSRGRSEKLMFRPWRRLPGPRAAGPLAAALLLCALAAALFAAFPARGPRTPLARVIVGLDEAANTTTPPPPTAAQIEESLKSKCSGPNDNCNSSKCCWAEETQCFEKNQYFAGCMKTCSPGIHPGDEDQMPWTCKQIWPDGAPPPPAPPAPGLCVAGGDDCTVSKCCLDPALKCFEKNIWFATCMVACQPGLHPDDKDQKPWTCNVLNKTGPPPTPPPAATTPAPTTPAPPASPQGPPTPNIECDDGPLPGIPAADLGGPVGMIKVLTYNLFWWNLYGLRHGNGDSASHLIANSNHPEPFDLLGFQECEGGAQVIGAAGMAGDYQMFEFTPLLKTTAICMAFRRSTFALIAQGQDWVAEDQASQYFGKRAVQWMRLHHIPSNKNVFFMNHHGPLVVDSGGKCGGAVTGFHLLRTIAANSRPGDYVIFVGDFNANPGSATMNVLTQRLRDFYPAGLDNIMTNLDASALVSITDLGNGGSDHDARMAMIRLGGAGGAPPPYYPPPAPPAGAWAPFDCSAGFDNWAVGWAADKKGYCCRELGRGCAVAPAVVLQ